MIKEKVILRSEVYHVYSSEQQERMKVYFDLSEKYQKCLEPCQKLVEGEICKKNCENIFNDYTKLLQHRYEGDKKQLIDAKVSGLPSFDSFKRKDRGFFYKVFGFNFSEFWEPDQRQIKQI
ncbi:unnamed protein product (macronuclear) [Paramecium tetraurelia]|uniref:Tim10-like domain-containing protein n=1 Tax=Paramecium tetraurelia TaxID=5888 RepID=A0BNQ1_PARTE|nr:uncharacterized protein GSPATT00030807001 [Paramecium tetraurelia]CAK60168.1 unnamed protein product [Paramecium tetraurelia]|eukprot:XP_001427566.1 hypothetical protein (macronuclear) [Paramecium tetraurelia strain d4-2]